MRITVLVDNNTLINKNYLGEHGLSLYIEEGNSKILFDTGYSDIFLRNAFKMGIYLKEIDYLVLSHGHLDHTWGINTLLGILDYYSEGGNGKRATLVAHPGVLSPKNDNGEQIGLIYSSETLEKCFTLTLSQKPVWISDRLVFLGQIERTNTFENRNPIGTTMIDGIEKEDFVLDDSALVYKSGAGLVIITGCSHSGICNIVEYAKKVCGDERILQIVGGLHLLNPSEEQLKCTLDYMEGIKPEKVYACHCTDLKSKIALSRTVHLEEVGVGTQIEF